MKKILISLLCFGLLTGCNSGDSVVIEDSNGDGNGDTIYTYSYTDKETGCEYIIFDWYQGGGASPKLDSKGEYVGCRDLK